MTILFIVIPTRGERETLQPLLSSLEIALPSARIVLAVNEGSVPASVASRVRVERVPTGYASSRNAAARIAIEEGAGSLLFVDDDVVVTVDDVRDFVAYAEQQQQALSYMRVRKRFDSPTPELATMVLRPKSDGPRPTSLPATFLHVPADVFSTLWFPTALDFTGAEDTLFTSEAQRAGYALVRWEHGTAFEYHPPERVDAHSLVARMLASKSAQAIYHRSRSPIVEWRSHKTRLRPGFLIWIIVQVSRLSPRAAVLLTSVIARVMGMVRATIAREGGEWSSIVVIR